MEMLCIGFLLGVVFSMIVFGAGVFCAEYIYDKKGDEKNAGK